MAGISKTRIDYGDKGPVKETDDQRSGGGPKSPAPSAPTRAEIPVKGTENDYRSDDSASSLETRKNTDGSK